MNSGPSNSGSYNFGPDNSRPIVEDRPNIWLGLLGFFLPVVGFIVWLVMRPNQPRAAHSAGVGTLIGFFVHVMGTALVILAITAVVREGPKWINAQATRQATNGTLSPHFQATPMPPRP